MRKNQPETPDNRNQNTLQPYKQEEANAIYADDTTLLLQKEPLENTITRLENYSRITTTRQLKIHWGKVEMLTKQKNMTGRKTTQHHMTKSNTQTPEQYWVNR